MSTSTEKRGGSHGDDSSEADQKGPAPYFPTVDAFVENYLARIWDRPITQANRWCDKWWAHPEVSNALTALWTSWEAMRLDGPTGVVEWLTRYAYPLRRELCAPDGPFKRCEPTRLPGGRGHAARPFDGIEGLPCEPAPPEVFTART